MATIVSFKGDVFPPSFGYLNASDVCSAVNASNPTWGVELHFSGNNEFSFSSNNAQYAELKAALMAKLMPLYGASPIAAMAYAQGNDIFLPAVQSSHLPHEAWHVVQQ